ncbi:MAG: 6,7-dimethyl-8-ribityllumazine synthase [Gammaproteobacteria bacterium]
MTEIEGEVMVREARFVLLVSRFNSFVVENLLAGAKNALLRHGATESDLRIVRVPGAYEMPLAARRIAANKSCDAIIALGAIIRGGTPHFEYVAGECIKGLSAVSAQFELPVALGVLTVDTVAQAIERAGMKSGNKGIEAAMSAIEMDSLLRKLEM